MKNILILSHDKDPHAITVGNALKKKNIPFFYFITEDLPTSYNISFDSKYLNYTIENKDTTINLDGNWNIWNRRILDPKFPDGININLAEIIVGETRKTWEALLESHKGRVISKPSAINLANNKLTQLEFVKRNTQEIYIPDTIVTNDPKKVKFFYETHCGNICFKLHRSNSVKFENEEYIVYTNKLKLEDLLSIENVRANPSMFQEYIDKEYELRITVIGNEVIPIAIHSQDSEISKVDFRRYDFDKVKYEYKKVPDDVSNLCLAITKHYGLNFGAFDFIKDKQGRYVFLELNPNGQWLWLEQLSGYKISEVLADYLIK